MTVLIILCALLAPQAIAAGRRAGPAAHLTLLLLALSAATTVLMVSTFTTWPGLAAGQTAPVLQNGISLAGLSVVGLGMLGPAYWAIEHIRPHGSYDVDTVLVQTSALTLAASLASGSMVAPGSDTPLTGGAFDVATLALAVALGLRAIAHFLRRV